MRWRRWTDQEEMFVLITWPAYGYVVQTPPPRDSARARFRPSLRRLLESDLDRYYDFPDVAPFSAILQPVWSRVTRFSCPFHWPSKDNDFALYRRYFRRPADDVWRVKIRNSFCPAFKSLHVHPFSFPSRLFLNGRPSVTAQCHALLLGWSWRGRRGQTISSLGFVPSSEWPSPVALGQRLQLGCSAIKGHVSISTKYCRNLVRLANGVPSDGWHGAGSLGANMTARAVARVLWMFGREESLRFLSGVTILSGPLHKAPYVCLRPCGGFPMYRSCVFNRSLGLVWWSMVRLCWRTTVGQ